MIKSFYSIEGHRSYKPVLKSDGNLDFNMGKTIILGKEPTDRHVYEQTQYFLENDTDGQYLVSEHLHVLHQYLVTDTST